MKNTWKRLSLVFLAAVLVLAGIFLAACGDEEQPVEPGEEQGAYYYDAGSKEYSLELILGNLFTLEIEDEKLSGGYVLDGELLTLNVEGGDPLSATYRNAAVSLIYGGTTYRFLRKIDYTVKFETDGGTAIEDVSVVNGKTVAKPADPQKDDLVFVGWYADSTFRTPFSFTQPITADITLHARFVANIDPEFTVSFDVNHPDGEPIPAKETVGHKLFNLPEPEWEDHTFVGWWFSHYHSAEQLTAQYAEQTIDEPITLYAVWASEQPVISISESGVVWQGRSGNNAYTLTMTGPDGPIVTDLSVPVANYDFDFGAAKEGDYVVSVTINGQTSTAYYKNKGLARVSVFEVEGSTLLFNAVPNATNYLLSVECGSADHVHTDIDLESARNFDFSECDMKEGGIKFVVKATAEGYVSSVSEPYTFTRTLGSVTDLGVDENTDIVSWGATDKATAYDVQVLLDGDEVFAAIVDGLTVDLQSYNSGEITVSVTPLAFGWSSPAATVFTYTKKHLATPKDLHLSASTLSWQEVPGALSYEVSIDGTPYPASGNTFSLAEYYDASKASYKLSVRAIGEDDAHKSLWAPDYVVRSGEMGEITYAQGKVTWDAVFGVSSYHVKLNEEEAMSVVGTSCDIVFTQKGDNTISVCAVTADGTESAWKSTTVKVYEIAFDAQGGDDIAPRYRAKGDPLNLPKPEYDLLGHTFGGWYTEAEGAGQPYNGETFEDEYDRTLYAKWTPNVYNVTFNMGAYGTGSIAKKQVTFGEKFKFDVPETTSVMYAFRGWYDSTLRVQYTDYKGESISDWLDAGNVTLTASWVAIFSFADNSDNTTLTISKAQGINYVTEVTVPALYNGKRISTVGDFSGCTNLKKISIPDSVTSINLAGDGAVFRNCGSLTDIDVYKTAHQGVLMVDIVYYSVDGVLFRYNEATEGGRMQIEYYPYARQATTYTIPAMIETDDGAKPVTAIPQGAFHANSYNDCPLATIEIPSTVSLIEGGAFYNFFDLTSIVFLPKQEGETEAATLNIRENAFGDPKTNMSMARIMSIKFPKRLSADPTEALRGMTYLAYVDVEEGGTYKSVNGLLCKDTAKGVELVFYPGNRHVDENGTAFVPNEITTTGRATEFVVPEEIYSIGDSAAKNTNLQKIVITPQVSYIGVSAFEGTTSLNTLEFQGDADDNDLEIAERAFLGERWDVNSKKTPSGRTNSLKTLTLPANLTKLGAHAFGSLSGSSKNNTALQEVYVNVERESVEFAKGAFDGTVPGTIYDASYVRVVHLGPGVPALEVTDIFGSNMDEVDVDSQNPNYMQDEDGVLYDKDATKLIFFPGNWNKEYTIPEMVTNIAAGMFNGRAGLTGITIHENVTAIGNEAFKNCTGLQFVTFKEGGDQPLTIGVSAFENCGKLTKVELPERLKSIGTDAFMSCHALTEFTIPKNTEELALYALYNDSLRIFDGCDLLTEIKVAEGNTHFVSEEGVLYTARAAKKSPDAKEIVYVPDQLLYCPKGKTGVVKVSGYMRTIATYSFGRSLALDTPAITEINFADAIPTYDPETGELQSTQITMPTSDDYMSPFSNLKSLVKVHLPKGLVSLEKYLFENCSALTTVNIPNTVTTIMARAFYNASEISSLTFDADDPAVEAAAAEEAGDAGSTEKNVIPLLIEDGEYGYGAFSGMKLTSIVFPARITRVGAYAFQNSTRLTSVTFLGAGSDFVIGQGAFQGCTGLSAVEFPETLREIGSSAFNGVGLESLTLPKNLETIGASAFGGNGALTGTLTIPKSVKTIGDNAFTGTGFSAIKFEDDSLILSIGGGAFGQMKSLTSVDFGVSNSSAGFELGSAPASQYAGGTGVFSGDTALTSIVLPLHLKRIGENTFLGLANLTSITFATSETAKSKLTTIEKWAFSKTGISTFSFPESEEAITFTNSKNDATAQIFKSCPNLTSVYLSSSVATISNVFNGCNIQTITVSPDSKYFRADGKLPIIYDKASGAVALLYGEFDGRFDIEDGATTVGGGSFANQTLLEIVTIPATVRTIGAKAFENCINLKQVIIANGSVLETIEEGAFYNCTALQSINFDVATHLKEFGDGAYSSSQTAKGVFQQAGTKSEKPLKITFPASVEKLGAYMFRESGVAEIDLSASTKLTQLPTGYSSDKIGVFSQCLNLTTVKLPATLTFLGTYTFSGDTALTTVDFGENTNLQYIADKASAPSHAGTGSSYVFVDCTALEEITLPSSVEVIGAYTFQNCTSLATVNGIENLTMICYHAFENTGLTSFTLPAKDIAMGTHVFAKCALLETVDLSQATITSSTGATSSGKVLNMIPANTFQNCSALTSVQLPDTITSFGANVFENCTSLKTMDLSRFTGLASLANSMFAGCTELTTVKLPVGETLTYLGTKTFQNCTSLKNINSTQAEADEEGEINLSGLTKLTKFSTSATANVGSSTDSYLFAGCTSIVNVVLPASGFIQLGGYSFQGCTSLASINLTGITTIGRYAFAASGLTSVTIPAATTNVYEGAFSDCASLKDVIFADGTGTVALTAGSITASTGAISKPGVFARSAVENITFSPRIKALTVATFAECLGLTEITLPATLNGTMGTYVFYNCTNLKKADLSKLTIASLGNFMFKNCTDLKDVSLGNALSFLGTNTFQGCTSLQYIDISMTQVTNLASSKTGNGSATVYLFDGCVNLDTVKTSPAQIKVVGAFTFRDCEKLTSFDFSGVTDLGGGAFQNAGLAGIITLSKDLANFRASSNIYPFAGCSDITSFKFSEDNSKFSIKNDSIVDANGTLYAMPGGITFEDGVLDLNGVDYKGLSLSSYLFAGFNVSKVILPDGMTEIPAYLFADSGVQEVEIPASVTSIGTNAFAGTYALQFVTFLEPENGAAAETLTFAAGSTSATGTTGAFFGSSIHELTLPERVTVIASGTFMNTANLVSVKLPNTLTTIEDYAFYGSGLKNIEIPASVTLIGSAKSNTKGPGVFAETRSLESVTFLKAADGTEEQPLTVQAGYNSTKSVGGNKIGVFEGSAIKHISLPGRLTKVADGMFTYSDLETVDFDPAIHEIGALAFGYSALKEAVVPDTITNIGNYAFCASAITKLVIPGTVTTIGHNVGSLCQQLIEVRLEDSAEGLERALTINQICKSDENLQKVYIGTGYTQLTTSAFLDCTSLSSMTLSEGIQIINSRALENCTSLMELVIPESVVALKPTSANSAASETNIAFTGWTSQQKICFKTSRYNTYALLGIDWMQFTGATIVFDYDPDAPAAPETPVPETPAPEVQA